MAIANNAGKGANVIPLAAMARVLLQAPQIGMVSLIDLPPEPQAPLALTGIFGTMSFQQSGMEGALGR